MNIASGFGQGRTGKVRWMGSAYSVTLRGDAKLGTPGVFESEVPAGKGPPIHIHHDADEIIHVIDGRFEFFLDGEMIPRRPGDTVVVPLRPATVPETDLERQLAAIWQDVLGLETISTTDTLFSLGADSLKVFRIASRMLDADLDLEARDLLEHPSVKDLAAYATNRNGSERRGPSRPSLRDFRNGARRAPVQGSTATAAPRDGR